jgi:hypothetical protein
MTTQNNDDGPIKIKLKYKWARDYLYDTIHWNEYMSKNSCTAVIVVRVIDKKHELHIS